MDLAAANQALQVINQIGEDGEIRFISGGSSNFDPSTGKATESTSSSQSLKIFFGDIDKILTGQTAIQAGDRVAWIAGAAIDSEPTTSDEIVDSNDNIYAIVDVSPKKISGRTILYELQVRR